VVVFYEHGNDPSVSTQGGKFLEQLSTYQLFCTIQFVGPYQNGCADQPTNQPAGQRIQQESYTTKCIHQRATLSGQST
jgi:hypothetical protein